MVPPGRGPLDRRQVPAIRIDHGSPFPLGATWTGTGVNLAVFSGVAEAVEVCLFDGPDATEESARLALPTSTGGIWHGFFPDLRPGQLYGLRVTGPYRPAEGPRCNPHKVLFDPYARAVGRDLRHDDRLYGYPVGDDDEDLVQDIRDSAAVAPLAAVIDPAFTWGADPRPRRALADTVLYELHVTGFTRRHPGVPEPLRGTFAGLAAPASVDHLLHLGVTAVDLLPVQYRVSERSLVEGGRSNYWGYNTLGFFAPDPRLAAASDPHGVVREFKAMVATLHDAGIAVLLDVVYNHTAEGSELGPTLSFRGLDNGAYYHLAAEARYSYGITGTKNTLDLGHPRTLQLVTDSLRYWVSEMHVDGFRFALAAGLARELRDFGKLSSFLSLLQQDPVLAQVQFVADPWQAGPDGDDPLPINWAGRNVGYRDAVRRFWAGTPQPLGEVATRWAGSGVNVVATHDGFTLADLVSYERKHNEANGHHNRDGTDENNSWNCGVEGPTDDPEITALRRRQVRNLLLTLALSRGTPMLQAGDEFGHTQHGNNNAYCQDNELSWLDWDRSPEQEALTEFTRQLLRLRADEPAFRTPGADLSWLDPSGRERPAEDRGTPGQCLGVLLGAADLGENGALDDAPPGHGFVLLLNAAPAPLEFVLPARLAALDQRVVLDTAADERAGRPVKDAYELAAHSAAVLLVTRPAD
jgi:glycogen operon protein